MSRPADHTREIYIEAGAQSLELAIAPDTDIDGEFTGYCLMTGQRLRVSGWLIESIEEIGGAQ